MRKYPYLKFKRIIVYKNNVSTNTFVIGLSKEIKGNRKKRIKKLEVLLKYFEVVKVYFSTTF